MDLDLSEMIQQTQGELEEKFEARNLAIVTDLPAEPAVVHVDGRRMWRVLENIYGNAAKYAMPGTRVYATLKTDDTKVRFSLKNVSEHQLNIQADELTERFIRGDISRSTEGSGLGLSIAKSLTTMQGGTFDLYLDGDLFRVDITFPRVKVKGNAAGVTEELAEKSSSGFTVYDVLDTSKVVAEKGMHLDQTGDLIRTAAELKPEVLFLALGLNDISGTDGDTDAFIEKYKAVLANVREQMPDAVLYINCVLPVSAQKEEEEPVYAKIPDYNTALKAMCDEEGITFIDNTEIVKDEYYEQDGEHMKAEYYPIWAEHMAEVAGI